MTSRTSLKLLTIMLLLGFASGLPLALSSGTLQAWYTVAGISVVGIGFLSLAANAYAYKFLWAPLMDRFPLPFLGRRRGWIFLLQLLLALVLALMALSDPAKHPIELALLASLLAFLSASQDIVLDAYRADILPAELRGLGMSFWISAYRVAIIVSGAVALALAADFGWRFAYGLMAILMLFCTFATLWSDEPVLQTPKEKPTFAAPFKEFFSRPAALLILLFIIAYKMGDAFAFSLTNFFYLKTLGFSLKELAFVSKVFGTIATLVGSLIGGLLMTRLSLYRALMLFGWLQGLAILCFIIMLKFPQNVSALTVTVFIEQFTSGLGTIAFLAYLMFLCDKRYTATQFAIFSALSAIGRIFVGPIAGLYVNAFGWIPFFIFSLVIAILGLWLLFILKEKIHG
jgi:PAT family beta-lactamase induction signal transducer AmpG